MNIIDAFHQLGSYRAAARLLGTTHKTVRRAVERQQAGGRWSRRPRPISKNTDQELALIRERVRASDGRISAKRLLPPARALGYQGSARNFRRAVASAKADWRQKRRIYRPWVPSPGQHLVIDWTKIMPGLHMFCAVLAWSRYRFIRFAADETRDTTLGLVAECFEDVGAVTAVLLSDRMGCLKNGIVANVVVPHPDYVRFAAHYGFRPDFCEGGDPESKGVVENLVGYAQRDLVVPANNFSGNLTLLRVDLVILDELGFAPLDATGSQLFFRFIAAAYERRSLGLASHWPFDQWGRFLPDETTAVSTIDRILHHAAVVVTEGESFRMNEAKTRGGGPPKGKG